MSSVCISSCVNDAAVPSRVRATYVNLHKWPESDAEFVRSLSFRSAGSAGSSRRHLYPTTTSAKAGYGGHPPVVDSISCRQMYLRSYTFTRKESVNERTIKCIGKVKEKVVHGTRKKKKKENNYWDNNNNNNSRLSSGFVRASEKGMRRVKDVPCAALKCFFRKLLFCSASVDVVDVDNDSYPYAC